MKFRLGFGEVFIIMALLLTLMLALVQFWVDTECKALGYDGGVNSPEHGLLCISKVNEQWQVELLFDVRLEKGR